MTHRPHIIGILAIAVLIIVSAFVLRHKENIPSPRPNPSKGQPSTSPSTNAAQKTSPASAANETGQVAGQSASSSTSSANKFIDQQSSIINPDKGVGESSLSLLGTVQADRQAMLTVRLPARIKAVPVQRGDTVRQGQLIVQLDDADFRAQLRTAEAGVRAALAQVRRAMAGKDAQRVKADTDVKNAQGGLRQARVKLQQAILARSAARDDLDAEWRVAQEGIRKAEAGLEQAQRTLRSLEELASVGGVSKSELEGARTQARIAQSDLATAKAQAQRLEAGPESGSGPTYRVALAQQDVDAAQTGVQQAEEGLQSAIEARKRVLSVAQEEVKAAEAALAQAKAGVLGAQAALDMMRLTSPLAGVVTALEARTGETAQPGVPLATITSLGDLRIEALVSARQLPRLRVGQPAKVTVDTQPGRTFPVVLSDIASTAEPDGRSFRVHFRFANAGVSLRPGQTARILLPAS